MATIERRISKKTGKTTWRALIRKKYGGKIVYTDTSTFSSEGRAKTWANKREVELEGLDFGNPEVLKRLNNRCETLAELLDMYKSSKEAGGQWNRSLKSVIKILSESDMAQKPYNQLTSNDVIEFCKTRRTTGGRDGKGASGATVRKDLTILTAVINTALPSWGIKVPKDFLEDAKPTLKHDKLTRRAMTRKRRPKGDELPKLLEAAEKHDEDVRTRIMIKDVILFAIDTAMRQDEICQLNIKDIDWDARTIIVRDRKDPESKEGNDSEVPLLGQSFEIIKRQCEGRTEGKVFPYTARSVCRIFLKLKKRAGIHEGVPMKDLRFHDLRREGASRLLELGMTLKETQAVTGHKDINVLSDIYASLQPGKLHDRFNVLSSQMSKL